MNENIIAFYQKVRTDDQLIEMLSEGETVNEIMEIAVTEAGKLGFHFTKDEAMAASVNLETLKANVMNDDELNDFELELIAAGLPINCSGGATEMS